MEYRINRNKLKSVEMHFSKGSKLILRLLLCFLDAFLFTWWYYNGTLFWVASGLGLIIAAVTFVNNKKEDWVYSMGHRNRKRPRPET